MGAIRSAYHPTPWHLRSFSAWTVPVPGESYPMVLSPHLRFHKSLEYMLPSLDSVNTEDETLGPVGSLPSGPFCSVEV